MSFGLRTYRVCTPLPKHRGPCWSPWLLGAGLRPAHDEALKLGQRTSNESARDLALVGLLSRK
jgi:hypothetical protein